MLVDLSKDELHILQSALNYISAAEEEQLRQQYGDVVRLYDKLKISQTLVPARRTPNE